MCGISGVVDLGGGPVSAGEVRPMNDLLRLRGPDDEGYWSDGACALGHRRLSIIDLSGGHQPMADVEPATDGNVVTVFNGEIYNFPIVRERLLGLGYRFRTRSDTEVIVHGWSAWGERVVEELDGMFALAVWDRRARKLLLARDRFGKKPLVWYRGSGRFVFASTLTALLAHPAVPRVIDQEALARYLALEFVPAPSTILAGVQKLEPGTRLVLDASPRLSIDLGAPGRIKKQRYWRLEVRAQPHAERRPRAELEEELRGLLVEAVKKRLMSDVPLGIFLSGGIDSSSIVAAASRAGAARLRTFSIGFGEASFDETEYAREVAEKFGTEHVEERLDPAEMLAIVPRLGDVLDEPMADGSIVPTYLLSGVARKHVTVALGGDGGDELFAGYPMYPAHRLATLAAPLLRGGILDLASRAAAHLPVSHDNLSFDFKVKKTLSGLSYPDAVRNYVWLGAFRPDELSALTGRPVDENELLAPVAAAYREAPGKTHLERVLYQDVRLYLPHHILMKVDRASMAHSLEVRAPLLDTKFAEFVAGLPEREKLTALGGSKAIFKRAMRPWLPARVIDRPKKGFGMPVGAWLRGPTASRGRASRFAREEGPTASRGRASRFAREEGTLRELAHDLLRGLGDSGLVSPAILTRLLDEHERGIVDHRKRLWTLLVLELWRRRHLCAAANPA